MTFETVSDIGLKWSFSKKYCGSLRLFDLIRPEPGLDFGSISCMAGLGKCSGGRDQFPDVIMLNSPVNL